MNVYPLENMTLEQAMQKQFKFQGIGRCEGS